MYLAGQKALLIVSLIILAGAAFFLWYLPMNSLWLYGVIIALVLFSALIIHRQNHLFKIARLPEKNPLPVLVLKDNLTVIYANPAAQTLAKSLFGEQASVQQLLPEELKTQLKKPPLESPTFWLAEHWYRYLLAQGKNKDWFCYLEDVTESEQRRQQLVHMAYHDPVTGLGNRALLLKEIEHAAQEDHNLSLILVAIEGLDEAASVQGLTHTEHYLSALGRQLQDIFSQAVSNLPVTVVRFNGYEFGALYPCELSEQQQQSIHKNLVSLLKKPQRIAQQEYWLTYYLGMAATDASHAEHLPRRAHIALYSGRTNDHPFQCYDVHLEQLIAERVRLEQALSMALENNEISLYYQAQIHTGDNRLVGFEALMRWQHEDKFISPGVFIPIAERHGLIRHLGAWAIDEACRTIAQWMHDGHGTFIAVNVSAQQFIDQNFTSIVRRALEKHQIPPSTLQLEITESLLMEDEQQSLKLMRELKRMGVSLAIDDFGTGYSSFAYLSRFPVDKLKIDRSFVLGLSQGPRDEAIVAAMLDVGEKLGMNVIAEGVEHDHELKTLERLGCQLVQGFYFSKPAAQDEAVKLFDEY